MIDSSLQLPLHSNRGSLPPYKGYLTVPDKPWGGRFAEPTDRRVEQFTESISFDRRLYAHDIAASIAHARMLAEVGLLTADECQQIVQCLDQIRQEVEQGRFAFSTEREDIHMNIEAALVDRLGDTGRKLHTARSRNDQVATDLKLWVRDAIDAIEHRLEELQRAFLRRAERERDIVLPGYTHLQRAQPVFAAHYYLAYIEKLARDRDRLADCRRRASSLPLGGAALAGTSLPIDRESVRGQLGFDRLASNSLDIAGDRDFVVEFVFCLTMIAEHLSGWAEEWILWSTTEFGFLRLPDSLATGSSIMPQKKNPDVLELIRGKSARVIGNLVTLLALVKALPLAYNRDLQEDKPALFDAYDTVTDCLDIAVAIVDGAELQRASIEARLEEGFLDATTLLEYLIKKGVPMRSAHEVVGRLVRRCEELATRAGPSSAQSQPVCRRPVRLADLTVEEFRAAHPAIGPDVYDILGVHNAVAAFRSPGSTAPAEVARQIEHWRQGLGSA